MNRRVLVAVLPGDEAVAIEHLMTVTRAAARARIRVACFRALPPARVDHHDRVVVDTDAEMDRIRRDTIAMLDKPARALEHATLEIVVRFGPPEREAATEADAFRPDLAVLFAPSGGPVPRARAWWLRRNFARRPRLQVIVLDMPRPADPRRLRTPAPATS